MIARSTQHGEHFAKAVVRTGETPQERVAMTPQVLGWAQRSSNQSTARLLVQEIVIASGDQLYALGHATRGPDGVLVLRAGTADGHELLLSTFGEGELREIVRDQIRKLWIGVAIPVTLVAVGAVLVRLSW